MCWIIVNILDKQSPQMARSEDRHRVPWVSWSGNCNAGGMHHTYS